MSQLDQSALIALADRGPRALEQVFRLARQGDWQTRALAWSAAGRIARAETFSLRAGRWLARCVPGLRARFPSAGHQGKYVRHFVANGLVDRSWVVRTAAALALGECGSPASIDALRRRLTAPYRAERIAAAAALVSCGEAAPRSIDALLDGAMPVPVFIGDRTDSLDFLETLAERHLALFERGLGGVASRNDRSADKAETWARLLAGPRNETAYSGADAEIERYDADGDTEYLVAKPFSRINSTQNLRLLSAFAVVAEHLGLPQNGRVLDLGGGSGWVSELLAKFGYRPFTLDVSSALLRVGRVRFARTGLESRGVVGDMTRLPIADASMDAVVVMDALHHVPDVAAVFREVHRVLVQGGRFVVAEPGEGHAETAKSRGEVIEHGVEEREIHLFEAIEYGRSAGFDDIRVAPHFAPLATMTPDDVTEAMAASQDRWTVRQRQGAVPFAQFVMQSMLERPILVFCKGQRPSDTRMSGGILRADIAARFRRERARVTGTVTLRNSGDTTWLGSGDALGHVRLGIQLLDADRRLLNMEFSRTALARNVSPGQSADVEVGLALPTADDAYVLKIDLVNEGICWFEDAGSNATYHPI